MIVLIGMSGQFHNQFVGCPLGPAWLNPGLTRRRRGGREKVSVIGAVSVSPTPRHLRLYLTWLRATAPFFKPMRALAVTVLSRLRKDANLRTAPAARLGKLGQPRIYGDRRTDLASGAAMIAGGSAAPWRIQSCVSSHANG